MTENRNKTLWHDIKNLGFVLVFVTVIVVALMLEWSPTDLWQFVGNLLATLISVFFALVVGLILFQRENDETEARVEKEQDIATYRTVEAAYEELCSILIRLDVKTNQTATMTVLPAVVIPRVFPMDDPDGKEQPLSVIVHEIEPTLLTEAARSRLFRQVDTASWIELAMRIRTYNAICSTFLSQRYESLGVATAGQKRATWDTAKTVEARRKEVVDEARCLKESLGEWMSENSHARPPD